MAKKYEEYLASFSRLRIPSFKPHFKYLDTGKSYSITLVIQSLLLKFYYEYTALRN
jgi:hypothetical protein